MQAHEGDVWPSAKIRPSTSRTIVSRLRLLTPLNEAAAAGRVTLVVAPGGSGKTTLLADWVRQAPVPVAWYAVDAADRDMRRLVAGLYAAVERAAPGVAPLASRAFDAGAPEAAALGVLLGTLENQPLALVVDDYHHLDNVPESVALWDHFLRFRPPTLALIILSRSVPLFGFASLAAFDDLVGLGREDLSFTEYETEDLLAAHGLTVASRTDVARRAGGWAAGILLLARAASNGASFLRAHGGALLEHLGGEIVAGLPVDLRTFLLESAALGPVTSEQADAMLGRRDSAVRYAEAAARGLFIEEHEGVYRYQDIFADYLVGVMRETCPQRLQTVRRAASAWWAGHGDLPRALGLLAAGEDWEALVATLERERAVLWLRGLWGTILAQAGRVPPAYHTPRLLALWGHARLERGEHDEALALADQGMAAAGYDEEWLNPALLRAQALIRTNRHAEALCSADAALAVARQCGQQVAVTQLLETRGAAHLRLGLLPEARVDLRDALAAYEHAQDTRGAARVLTNLATLLVEAGYAREAEEYLTRARVLWHDLGNTPLLGHVHNTWALLHQVNGDVVRAREEVDRALDLARASTSAVLECHALATLAAVCADSGTATEAERHAAAAVQQAARLDVASAHADALRTLITAALLRRERARARALLDEARPLMVTEVDHALLDLLEGMLAHRSGSHARADVVLQAAAQRLEAVNRPHNAARAHLLRADSLLATGAVRRAEEALNRAAELVLPLGCDGYLRPLARLARTVMAQRRTLRRLREETRRLLDRLAATTPLVVVSRDGEAAAPPVLYVSPFDAGQIQFGAATIDPAALPVKAREVLFYATGTGRPVSRDELLDVVWDGDLHAAQALWDASRHLRRVLGERVWGRQGTGYAVQGPVEHAGRRFYDLAATVLRDGPRAARLGAADEALELAGSGAYLAWCESLWAATERARVGERLMAVLLTGARLLGQAGRHDDAIALCRRAVDHDPLDEAPRAALVAALRAAGRPAEAADAGRAYRRALDEEMAPAQSAAPRPLAPSSRRDR